MGSAAIVFKATTAIQGAPNEHAMTSSETLATRQDSPVSMEDLIITLLQIFPAAIETDDFNLFAFLDGGRESGPLDKRIGVGKRHQHRAVLDFEGANENFSIRAHFDLSPDVIFADVVGGHGICQNCPFKREDGGL